ncbi:hypothetical protein [Acanthamoeba castellanii mimivirus]|uniref:Uncharacterized protein L629 n=5 Tax=Mimivirus TaxID=315393 RepID=YL629_MIMIV|nr:hypothetical protein MIMI_gp0676 [Acanthamoeba polyphaga mimivirus]Q5UR79.1 RecName: Full=Uncharacterized protein L629 [Acanthamoeba polyphaga mimivirus]AEQ60830.1 hypothetical protein [Acanthamoeba castellanii mamavirus]AHA45215.1 hypothetical protein HIRU_S309 [Hirudovirus strain Sangsue]ALR84217.1 hypothetical protein [Niemeyer virus]AMK61977.1 hypothetical protein [Samba virus]AMZ03072.1 hypothetical protein [Mimivirus Bombay]EJN41050.1 hypothetical protein lvs_L547 [Acanthamoeba poly
MCIIADSVKNVSNTKIASFHVAYSVDNNKNMIPSQLIVYAAKIDSTVSSNAIILPVYNPGNDSSKIIPLDLSNFSDFFDKLSTIYGRWFIDDNKIQALSYRNGQISVTNSILQVYTVGDYRFSIMPSKKYFNNLDKSQLNVDPRSKISIDQHNNDYSFIVFQFYQKGVIDITPFGYLCPTNSTSQIVPTIHGHPENNDFMPMDMGINISRMQVFSSIDQFNTPIGGRHNNNFENEAEFDHEIYLLVKDTISAGKSTTQDVIDINNLLKKITHDYANNQIRLFVPKNFIPGKIKITGKKPNRNIFVGPNNYRFMNDLLIDNQK